MFHIARTTRYTTHEPVMNSYSPSLLVAKTLSGSTCEDREDKSEGEVELLMPLLDEEVAWLWPWLS